MSAFFVGETDGEVYLLNPLSYTVQPYKFQLSASNQDDKTAKTVVFVSSIISP